MLDVMVLPSAKLAVTGPLGSEVGKTPGFGEVGSQGGALETVPAGDGYLGHYVSGLGVDELERGCGVQRHVWIDLQAVDVRPQLLS
jgi:hypothetical protein